MPATQTPYTILVVDDEPVVLAASERILTANGFTVRAAADAESALALMQTTKPDVALVDLKLPGLSGIEFMAIAAKTAPSVVVIITTGYASADQAVASLQHGAFDFLPKPFTFDELLSLIHRACRSLQMPETAPASPSDALYAGYYFLGRQAWAKPEADGTTLLGVTAVFQQTAGPIEHVALPDLNDHLRQGGLLARITTKDHLVHTAWSALSGRVLATNPTAPRHPGLINKEPLAAGWIARIDPANLIQELDHLR